VDLLDIELNVIRNIRWELAKLHDEAAVVRCMSFIMDHLGFERRTPTDDDEM
jgi:hypothetical protein